MTEHFVRDAPAAEVPATGIETVTDNLELMLKELSEILDERLIEFRRRAVDLAIQDFRELIGSRSPVIHDLLERSQWYLSETRRLKGETDDADPPPA